MELIISLLNYADYAGLHDFEDKRRGVAFYEAVDGGPCAQHDLGHFGAFFVFQAGHDNGTDLKPLQHIHVPVWR